MSARKSGWFRRPKTTNEKRLNAVVVDESDDARGRAKGRIRGGKGKTRLADRRDDEVPASKRDRSRGKRTQSDLRK